MAPYGHMQFVEIPLDEELCTILQRRSHRQLQNIRGSSSAQMELDQSRRVLAVCGTATEIESVKKQLQALNGPRKPIPTAVWAELMRTRTDQIDETAPLPSPNVSIAGLQAISGCRIHLDRSRCEVRIFGPDGCAGVEIASGLIDNMSDACLEERVLLGNVATPPDGVLRALGDEHGATVLPSDEGLVVLGVAESVQRLVERLQRCISGRESWPEPRLGNDEADLLRLPIDNASVREPRRKSSWEKRLSTGATRPIRGTCHWDTNGQKPDSKAEAPSDVIQPVPYENMHYTAALMQMMSMQMMSMQMMSGKMHNFPKHAGWQMNNMETLLGA